MVALRPPLTKPQPSHALYRVHFSLTSSTSPPLSAAPRPRPRAPQISVLRPLASARNDAARKEQNPPPYPHHALLAAHPVSPYLSSDTDSGPLGREFCVLEPTAGGVLRAGADGRLDHVACWRPQSDKLPHHGRFGRVPAGL